MFICQIPLSLIILLQLFSTNNVPVVKGNAFPVDGGCEMNLHILVKFLAVANELVYLPK